MNLERLIEITDSISTELVPIPEDSNDVCPICRTGKDPNSDTCSSCEKIRRQLSRPLCAVIPISYYRTPSPFREVMHDYKEHEDYAVRKQNSQIVAGILVRYLHEHGESLAEAFDSWDEVVAVPSTKNPPGSALGRAITDDFRGLMREPAEWLAKGKSRLDRNQASDSGFMVIGDVAKTRILLIDDTYTTGAHLQSAASALQSAGAFVIAGLVIARKINPQPWYHTQKVWNSQEAISFDFTRNPWWRD